MTVAIRNLTRTEIDVKAARRAAEIYLRVHKVSNLEVSIVFIGDKRMRELNRVYRHRDKPTDILSFAGQDGSFGEIIIDYAQIKRQARAYSRGSARRELIFILVHGLLHLSGYDDNTERARSRMIALGEDFIKKYL